MNIQSVIEGIRSQWAANLPDVPLYLQLAPDTAQVPYAVANVGTVNPADYTTGDRDYETAVTFVCYSAGDTECLARMDRIAAAFDRAKYDGPYLSALNSATFDINYTDQAALWSSEMTFSIRWNR